MNDDNLWIDSTEIVQSLLKSPARQVKVRVLGHYVGVVDVHYSTAVNASVIEIDEDDPQYMHLFAMLKSLGDVD